MIEVWTFLKGKTKKEVYSFEYLYVKIELIIKIIVLDFG